MATNEYKSNLEKLKAGTVFRNIKKETSEPENIAVGQISKELRFFQRQTQYINEIERILKELRLTSFFIQGCKEVEPPDGISRQELLIYYQGIFLTLVHQMKDKVAQLIYLITETEIPEKPSIEKDISVSQLLKRREKELQAIGIVEEVKKWQQEHKSSEIAVVLRKRTQHHHRVSGLSYDEDFLNLVFTDIATKPNFQLALTDKGKERIESIKAESTERLFSKAASNVEDTFQAIEESVEKILGALVDYCSFPLASEEIKKTVEDYDAMLESLDIVNKCSSDKIPREPINFKPILNALVEKMKRKHGDDVIAIYLVGSVGRGEYEFGYSDVNVYLVLNIDKPAQAVREDEMVSLRIFTLPEFLSEGCKKFRAISKIDGVLLYGEDISNGEQLPKAGLLLALILNDDILEIFDEAQRWMEGHPEAVPEEIGEKSKRLAKRILDFFYGVAMANKPQFTASRQDRLVHIIEVFPGNKGMVDTLMNISRYGVGELESFSNLISEIYPQAEESLNQMNEIKIQLEGKSK